VTFNIVVAVSVHSNGDRCGGEGVPRGGGKNREG